MSQKQVRIYKQILSARTGPGTFALAITIASASGGSKAATRRSDALTHGADGGAATAAEVLLSFVKEQSTPELSLAPRFVQQTANVQ